MATDAKLILGDHPRQLITAEGELREKNQLTLPKRIVDALGLRTGDRLAFVVDDCDPSVVHVQPLRESYAGALAGIYGTPEEIRAHLEAEREAWEE